MVISEMYNNSNIYTNILDTETGAYVHAMTRKNILYVQTVRLYIYETRQNKHLNLQIYQY